MINQENREQIIAAFSLGSNIEKFDPLPHPWSESHTFMCIVDSTKYVMRRWRGSERIGRMHEENSRLSELSEKGFSNLSLPILGKDNSFYYMDSEGVAWTAYEYVNGGHITNIDLDMASKAGKTLGTLHNTTTISEFNQRSFISRLQTLPQVLSRMKEQPVASHLGRKIEEEMLPQLKNLPSLPVAVIHGDFIFENLLMRDDKIILIDFEFSRTDYRVFDIAATVAPLRYEDGSYILADKDFMSSLISSYSNVTSVNIPLSQKEISLLPSFAAAHFCFVYDDLTNGNCPFNNEALKVLDSIVAGNLDWMKEYKIPNAQISLDSHFDYDKR